MGSRGLRRPRSGRKTGIYPGQSRHRIEGRALPGHPCTTPWAGAVSASKAVALSPGVPASGLSEDTRMGCNPPLNASLLLAVASAIGFVSPPPSRYTRQAAMIVAERPRVRRCRPAAGAGSQPLPENRLGARLDDGPGRTQTPDEPPIARRPGDVGAAHGRQQRERCWPVARMLTSSAPSRTTPSRRRPASQRGHSRKREGRGVSSRPF